jgi:hypothetical protein
MPRKRKVWTSEDQILAKIDSTRKFAARKAKLAEHLSEEVKRLAKEAQEFEDNGQHNMAASRREKCGDVLKKSEEAAKLHQRTIDRTLPRLGEILSAFRTATMPELLGDYKGVVVK